MFHRYCGEFLPYSYDNNDIDVKLGLMFFS